jgi:hypothetical protein
VCENLVDHGFFLVAFNGLACKKGLTKHTLIGKKERGKNVNGSEIVI